jgi:hypothetical protein
VGAWRGRGRPYHGPGRGGMGGAAGIRDRTLPPRAASPVGSVAGRPIQVFGHRPPDPRLRCSSGLRARTVGRTRALLLGVRFPAHAAGASAEARDLVLARPARTPPTCHRPGPRPPQGLRRGSRSCTPWARPGRGRGPLGRPIGMACGGQIRSSPRGGRRGPTTAKRGRRLAAAGSAPPLSDFSALANALHPGRAGNKRRAKPGKACPALRRLCSLLPYYLTSLLDPAGSCASAAPKVTARPPGGPGWLRGGAGRGGDNAARECGASGRAGTVRAMARSDHTGAWFHAGVPMRCREGRLRRPAPDEPRQDLAGSASGSARRNARERNSPSGSCPGRSRHRRLPRRTRPTPGFVMSGFV